MKKLLGGLAVVLVIVGIKFGAVALKIAMRYATRLGINAAHQALTDTPARRTVQRYLAAMLEMPEFQERMQAQRAKRDDYAPRLAALATKGVRRLDGEALGAILEVRERILASVDPATCAAYARDEGAYNAGDAMFSALAELDSALVERYMLATRQAVLAELKQSPPRQLSDDQLTDAFIAVYQRIPEKDRARFTAGYVQAQSASDADACWATRTLYRAWATLPEQQKRTLALGIAQEQ
jgi:hypothetical protein